MNSLLANQRYRFLRAMESSRVRKNQEHKRTLTSLCKLKGLNFEQHTVTTSDGYRLKVFHIWHRSTKGPPVFFQHGLASAGDTWMVNGDKAPAFMAAKKGYDVWIGNNRGTRHSRGHSWLDATRDKEYFDYSFYELGKYDAPAQIDFVRRMTSRNKIAYIGHS